MALTAKQSNFAVQVVAGKSLADAYRNAYNTKRMTDAAIRVEASKLAKNPAIALTIREGKSQAMSQAVWNRQLAISRLETINDQLFDAITNGDASIATVKSFLDVTKELNHLCDTDFELEIRHQFFKGAKNDTFGLVRADFVDALEALQEFDNGFPEG